MKADLNPASARAVEAWGMKEREVEDIEGFTSRQLRDAFGSFCTGVTIIAAADADGTPIGFAAQSFTALSLDPPLILFCPTKTSRSWTSIERAGRFCVSMLAENQQHVSNTFGGGKEDDKFAEIDWVPNAWGAPRIQGALGYLDCHVTQVVDGGDHWIVLGQVDAIGKPMESQRPLLFYKGAYMEAEPVAAGLGPESAGSDNFLTADVWF